VAQTNNGGKIKVNPKLIALTNGDTVIADITEEGEKVILNNACVLQQTGQTTMGFMPWPQLGNGQPITIDSKYVLYQSNLHPKLEAQYLEANGGIVVPQKPSLIL